MILNLTQHKATPEQVFAGVVDLPEDQQATLHALLTFDEMPTQLMLHKTAQEIAELAAYNVNYKDGYVVRAMIGGAPYLMPHLEATLRLWQIQPVYAFTKRTVFESTLPDGTVSKRSFFRHEGFIRA
jgi:hypothetical protein